MKTSSIIKAVGKGTLTFVVGYAVLIAFTNWASGQSDAPAPAWYWPALSVFGALVPIASGAVAARAAAKQKILAGALSSLAPSLVLVLVVSAFPGPGIALVNQLYIVAFFTLFSSLGAILSPLIFRGGR